MPNLSAMLNGFLLSAALGLCLALSLPSQQASAATDEALEQAIKKVLRDNPALILEVLQDQSEAVYEIAQQGQMLRSRKALRTQWDADVNIPKNPALEGLPFRGKADAPVTIVVFSDYLCPYCRLAEQNLVSLEEKYKGKVRVFFKPLPNEKNQLAVAVAKYGLAAFAQDQEKGWQFHEALFEGVEQIERNGDNAVKAIAVKCGLDLKKLNADAASAKVQERLAANEAEAESFGIRGTPYFLVNDIMVRGAISREMFDEAIARALELASKK